MKTKHLSLLLSVPLLHLSVAANAQTTGQDTAHKRQIAIQEVVVTGQYVPGKVSDAVHRVRVISSQKIAAMAAQNIRDVLLNEMNVTISQDNIFGSSVQIQGISGQNVKVLIDGVPVIGRQDGKIDLSQLNVYNVERIEIVEGPMSVTYGTDAMAGTINIITKSSVQGKWEGAVNTYYETIGKYNLNASAGLHKGKHTFMFSGARNFFDGWNPGESVTFLDFSKKTADLNRAVQWDPKEEYNGSWQYIYKRKKLSLRYKGDYFYDKITNRGLPAEPYYEKAFDDVYRTTRFNNAAFVNLPLKSGANINVLAAYNQYKRVKNTYENNLTNLSETLSSSSDQDTTEYSLFNSRATLSSGKENATLNFETGYDINIEHGTGKRILGKEQQIGDYAVYGSVEYKPFHSLTLRPGLRYAYNTAFDAPLIPSVNARYQWRKVTVRASYARGFRAPNVKELFFEFKDSNHDIVGNPNLKSEDGDNFNLSGTYENKIKNIPVKIEVAAFYNAIRDMITLAQPDTNIVRYTYINVDVYKTHGIQLNGSATYSGLTLNVGGSYVGRYNQLSAVAGISAFSYSPELRANLMYELPKHGWSASVFFKYSGPMPGYALGTDENGKQAVVLTTLQDYSMADCSVSKKLWKDNLVISAGIKNIFDITNLNVNGAAASGTAHSSGSGSVSMSTGRSLFISLGYQFRQKN